MTFQPLRCNQCNEKFCFTGKQCNTCLKPIYNECWNCHKMIHRYNTSEEHGLVRTRYMKLLASMSILSLIAIESIYFIGATL